jgi:hypothetical protein
VGLFRIMMNARCSMPPHAPAPGGGGRARTSSCPRARRGHAYGARHASRSRGRHGHSRRARTSTTSYVPRAPHGAPPRRSHPGKRSGSTRRRWPSAPRRTMFIIDHAISIATVHTPAGSVLEYLHSGTVLCTKFITRVLGRRMRGYNCNPSNEYSSTKSPP